jgi:hypothetical protein
MKGYTAEGKLWGKGSHELQWALEFQAMDWEVEDIEVVG